MQNDIILSVIVPVYNTEKYLEQCIESLLAQTLENIEFIFINDGSTDASLEILEKYLKNSPPPSEKKYLRLINQENKQKPAAYNAGLAIAKGKYVGLVDSDDFIDKNMFKLLVDKALEGDFDVVACSFFNLFEKNNTLSRNDNSSQINALKASGGSLKGAEEIFLDHSFVWNKIYKRDLLNNYGIVAEETLVTNDDLYFNRKVLLYANKIAYIPNCLYYYRFKRQGALTTIKDENNFSDFIVLNKLKSDIHNLKADNMIPYWNHLVISLLCLGYERLENNLKQKYFDMFYNFLVENNIKDASNIAFPKNKGGFSFCLRYKVLRILHPLTINAVLNKNKLLFDFIIFVRKFLYNLSHFLC